MYRNLKSEDYFFYAECEIGLRCYLNASYVSSGGTQFVASRLFRDITRTGAQVGPCQLYSSTSGWTNSLTRLIPHKIWAIL
jgi:hypothetical protein